jgi:hypothetical protein
MIIWSTTPGNQDEHATIQGYECDLWCYDNHWTFVCPELGLNVWPVSGETPEARHEFALEKMSEAITRQIRKLKRMRKEIEDTRKAASREPLVDED